jgi:hypothetical protein
MTTANHFPESLLNIAEEQTAKADQKAKGLQAQADEAASIQKLCQNVTSYLRRGWTLHLLDAIDKQDSLIKKMKADNHPTISFLEEIYQIAKDQVAQIKPYRFPAELEGGCRAANLPLDRDSAHPNYKFENGFFQIRIDDHKKTARLSDYELPKLCEVPADVGAIIEAVQREQKRVFGRKFDAKVFLKKLRKQYLEVIKKQKLTDGSSIPIRDITRRLGKNEKGFRTDEFLIDLSRLVEQNFTEIEGRKFEFTQTKDTTQGLLLHIENKRYIGSILFKKV